MIAVIGKASSQESVSQFRDSCEEAVQVEVPAYEWNGN